MSEPGVNTNRKVVRLAIRRVERRVPGLGPAVFRAPSVGDEMRLVPFYDAEAPNHRAFVNETVATTLETPVVDPADVDTWTERARGIARVSVAEAAGCTREYRRLAGSSFSGDERLYRAMRARHERQLEHLRRTMAGVSENVVRLVGRTHKAVRQTGVLESVEHNQRHLQLTGPVKMWRSLIMGLVLPAGLTRTGPDCVSLPGFVGRSGKAMWCTRPDGLV
jgi:hypothetical protein